MAEPGDEVVLRVTVEEPASLVGVLVVDEATESRGSHDDLTQDSVRSANPVSRLIISEKLAESVHQVKYFHSYQNEYPAS